MTKFILLVQVLGCFSQSFDVTYKDFMHACTLGKQALENYKFPSMFSFLDIDLVYTASLWSSAFEIPLIDGGTWGF